MQICWNGCHKTAKGETIDKSSIHADLASSSEEEDEAPGSDEEDSFPFSPYVDMSADVRKPKTKKSRGETKRVRFAPVHDADEADAVLVPFPGFAQLIAAASNSSPLNDSASANIPSIPHSSSMAPALPSNAAPALSMAADLAAQIAALGPPPPRQMKLNEFFQSAKPKFG